MSNDAAITLSYPEPDIALLTLDAPDKGANVLSRHVLDELASHLNQLETRDDLAGLIVCSGKPTTFIAGADIREFAASFDVPKTEVVAMCNHGRTLFERFSKCPFVTVAAVHGLCVGGGAELAVWCDRRVLSVSNETKLGFPEVKLGIYPGWGGTVRTPRIVGLSNAVEMISSGDPIDAAAAFEMALATDVVPAEDLQAAAIRLVRTEQATRQFERDRDAWSAPIEISETELGFLGAIASGYIQQQTKGHYPAPLAALEVLLGGATVDAAAAGEMEAAGMAELFGSPISRALINVFFLTDRNKKDNGLDGREVETTPIESISVIGAGVMGQGIAAAAVRRKIPAALTDAALDSLQRGVQKVLEEVSYNKKLKGPDFDRAVEYGPLLNATTADKEIAAADLVIEAVIELPDVKRDVYARLESQMSDDAILATNTSTIPVTTLAVGLARPERFAGLHFFNPVRKMPLVEVIRGAQTSDETVASLVAYAKRIGKSPIVVADGPGFLVNRLLLPYMNEAAQLLIEGASPKAINRAATHFGMPMGPINLYDVVGLDVAVHAGRTMLEAFPDRVIDAPLLEQMVAAGRIGKKSGKGFFSYDNKKGRPQSDPDLDKILDPLRASSPREFDRDELVARLFMPMLLEATRTLEEGIVRDARDVDLGMIFGTGFPPFKGGLLFWADTLGAEQIIESLKPLESLGRRYQPTEMLLEMAQSDSKFYRA